MPGYGLALTLINGAQRYTATVINRLHAIVNTQLFTGVESQGQGVRVSRFGDTSFLVTAGTGLQVLVAPGTGTVLGTGAVSNAHIRRDTQLPLVVPASSTVYIWQGVEQRTTPTRNFTEETGLPLTFWSGNAVEPNAIPLATVTTSGSAVTGVVDTRGLPIDRVDPEQIRDAFAASVLDSPTIDFTDNDAANTSTFDVKDNSLLPIKNVFPSLGDLLYGGVAGAGTRLPGNTVAAKRFLSQTGTGTASAAPAWSAIVASDLPAGGTISGYDSTNGQDFKTYQIQELVTVAASATTSTTITVPAGCTVRSVALRVTTAIPTATTFDIGVAGATTRYGAALGTGAGVTNVTGGSVNPSCYASTVALTLTPNATPASNTGRVRVVIWYELATAPTS